MSWAFRLTRVAGIDIKIHVTFLLILVLGGMEWGSKHGAPGAVFGVLLMLALFTCVTLHELGHSLAAQRFGIPVREIVLLPIGGVAMLGRLPDRHVDVEVPFRCQDLERQHEEDQQLEDDIDHRRHLRLDLLDFTFVSQFHGFGVRVPSCGLRFRISRTFRRAGYCCCSSDLALRANFSKPAS